jgi:hypothetical protein
MDFAGALALLRAGKRIAREVWDDGEWLILGTLSLGGTEVGANIYLIKSSGEYDVWGVETPDILAKDWGEYLVN